MVSTKSVALFALVAMAGASSVFADKAGEASESGKMMKSPKLKLDKHAAKADEAGEAFKVKPAKVRRLEESSARERRDVFFFFPVFFVARHTSFSNLFLFLHRHSASEQKQVHVKKAGKADEAGEALKAKPAKVRRLEREQRAREREETCFLLPSIFRRSPHKFFLTSFSFLFSHLTNRSTLRPQERPSRSSRSPRPPR